jgi:hypothetical protein
MIKHRTSPPAPLLEKERGVRISFCLSLLQKERGVRISFCLSLLQKEMGVGISFCLSLLHKERKKHYLSFILFLNKKLESVN